MSEPNEPAVEASPEEATQPQPPAQPSEREQSTTVGTGSYVAVSCTVMAFALTFLILGILFLIRWLS